MPGPEAPEGFPGPLPSPTTLPALSSPSCCRCAGSCGGLWSDFQVRTTTGPDGRVWTGRYLLGRET
ncbi:hypothetical protein DMA15_07030 [Streptomyces sp. WAC 01529]|nr:hypothetical protein DMA15_07030 [Streptomyces sp. WAC 01529]